jgi:hypothetical protein
MASSNACMGRRRIGSCRSASRSSPTPPHLLPSQIAGAWLEVLPGLVRVRLTQQLQGLRRLWHPADCLGDVGAATGGVLMAVLGRSFQRGYAPADRALLWAGNDEGQRTALVLARA